MSENIKISIVVPVFNTGKLLFPCVRSLLSQSLPEIEIIIVDDGSEKYTRRICEKLASKFSRVITLIRFPLNKRQGAARNEAIKHASGDYIGLVDSDDYIALDMYEKLYKEAEERGADIVDCDLIRVGKTGRTKYEISNTKEQVGTLDVVKRKSLILNAGRMVTKIVKRRIWLDYNIQYPEGISYEDNTIAGLHFMYADTLAKIDEGLYFYRDNPDSTIHKVDDSYLDRLTSAELFLEEYKKRGFYEKFFSEVEQRFVELYYLNSYRKVIRRFSQSKALLPKILASVGRLCPAYRENIYFRARITSRKRRETYWLEKFPGVVGYILRL